MQRFFYTFFMMLASSAHCAQPIDWNVLIFMQADGILKAASAQAIHDLKRSVAQKNEQSIRLFVQVTSGEAVDRFSNIANEFCLQREHVVDSIQAKELEDACAWAFKECNATHTMIIFSGHGSGILQPIWNSVTHRWGYEQDNGECYYADYRKRQNKQFFDIFTSLCDGHKSVSLPQNALLVDSITRSLQFTAGLLGKKIDIIGFDACHMAMIEIAALIQPSAKIMIASQDCEEKEGWNYEKVMHAVGQGGSCQAVARKIIYAHEKAQKQKQIPLFSLSALDLTSYDLFEKKFEKVSMQLQLCIQRYGEVFHDALCSARKKNQRFCFMTSYADIQTFFEQLLLELSELESNKDYEELQSCLFDVLESLKQMILAQCAGESCLLARGCSIYFPYAHVDSTYQNNCFAQKSQWIAFLKAFIGQTSLG